MAISNLNETLLMYTKYRSRMSKRMMEIQMNLLSATKTQADIQSKFNAKQQEYYYEYNQNKGGEGMEAYQEEYNALCAEIENEMQLKLRNVKSWEEQLTTDQLNCEVRLAEITQNENNIKQQLKTNLKSDFTYGGAGQQS